MQIHEIENGPVTPAATSRRSAARWLWLALVVAGCRGLESVAPYKPISDPAKLFMSLALDHRAITMSTVAPYDTLQLAATPRDGTGAPMSGLPAPTFTSSDTTVLRVTPDGLLQARAEGSAMVIADLRADGNIRHADTAYVNVTAGVTPLATLSIHPPTPDDSVWSMVPHQALDGLYLLFFSTHRFYVPSLTTRTLDANGNPIPRIAVEYQSLDPDVVYVDPHLGDVRNPFQPGTARIVARATAYGVTKVDTARFITTEPFVHGVIVTPAPDSTAPPTLEPQTVRIRAGGYVFFSNLTSDSVRVTFADPASAAPADLVCSGLGGVFCDGGDIPNFKGPGGNWFSPNRARGRHFTVPGTYEFRIEPLGLTGQIIVDPYPPS